MRDENSNSVVITGVGAVSPIGIGRTAFLQSLLAKTSGVKVRTPFDDVDSPYHLASSVDDFEPRKLISNRKALKVMCHEIQLGFVAATLAVQDAGLRLEAMDPDRIGVISGAESFYCHPDELRDVYVRYDRETGHGAEIGRGIAADEPIDYGTWIAAALRETQPLWMLKYLPNMVSCQIAIAIDARGPNNSIFQGNASSLLSVQEAAHLIRRGVADVMIAGGSGARMNIVGMMYGGTRDLCRGISNPRTALRPFDVHRTGTVAGEGAGMVILESERHAAARSANVLARLDAMASTCATAMSDRSDAMFRAMSLAKSNAGVDNVDTIYAQADGSTTRDAIEAAALQKFCDAAEPDAMVTAPAGYYGDVGTGTMSLNLIAAILGLHENFVPPTLNFSAPDPGCKLNIVHGDPLQQSQNHVLITSGSRTGQAAAVCISRP